MLNKRSSRRGPVALMLAFLILIGFAGAVAYVSPGPDPDYAHALWVAQSRDVLKLTTADGQVRLRLPGVGEIEALAVDGHRGRLWMSGAGRLRAYDFAGTRLFDIDLPGDDDDDDAGALGVDSATGSVWLAQGEALYRIDESGQLAANISLDDEPEALAVDPSRHQLWLALKHELRRYSEDGLITQHIDLGEDLEPELLAFDRLNDALWVATEHRLLRLDANGNLFHIARLDEIERLAATREGTLWLAGEKRLYHIDASGLIGLELAPFTGEDRDIEALAADPADASVWVAGEARLVHIASDGRILHRLDFSDHDDEDEIHALAVYADLIAPALRILAPEQDAYINTNRPKLVLEYEDIGIGVDPESLLLSADGTDIIAPCTLHEDGAICIPDEALTEGYHRIEATVADYAGNRSATAARGFTVDTIPPAAAVGGLIHINEAEQGRITVTGEAGSVEPGATVVVVNERTGERITVTADAEGGFSAVIDARTGDVLIISVVDRAGNTSEPYSPLVAPAVDASVATTLYHSTRFLYTGASPVQTGVQSGVIEPRRAALLRGRVSDRDGKPIGGVEVSILGHPEFGQTHTRADGQFDMVVNGGGPLTLDYKKSGLLRAQRTLEVAWQEYAWAPDLVMIALDSRVTPVDLNAAVPFQVVRGTQVNDADGKRQATLLFPQGTRATLHLADGTTRSLDSLKVRATEYTVGEAGPKTMPGELPPSSGYTYAVELSADEALAVGAQRLDFDRPVPFYLENYLGFPVGETVPSGWYDFEQAAWIPADNGRVVEVLAIANGVAVLDVEGGGQAATVDQLSELGITDAELARLAELYTPGTSLWRAPISHFTPWDLNWSFGPPGDATAPTENGPDGGEDKPDDPDIECNSIIGCQSQVLGESVPVTGTPFTLNYRSDRVPGRLTGRELVIPLTDDTVPTSLKRIDLDIRIAGLRVQKTFRPKLNRSYTFTWDGRDAYGRSMLGQQTARIEIGYVYNGSYQQTDRFGYNGNGTPITGDQETREVTLWRRWQQTLSAYEDARGRGLGGWTLDAQHLYSVSGRILQRGDGSTRSAAEIGVAMSTAAGYSAGFRGDGGPATSAYLNLPFDVAAAPDGSLYIADTYNQRIRKIDPQGVITTVAGDGTRGYSGDGASALSARLNQPQGVAIGPDGSLYIADTGNHRIRRVSPEGRIETVAGTGVAGFAGDEGPANAAQLSLPARIAVHPDGTLFIADTGNQRIRRVAPDGRIHSVAGDGVAGFAGDGGPAVKARLSQPTGLAVDTFGNLYVADLGNHRIRRITPDGQIDTVAGTGEAGFNGDGAPARSAQLQYPADVDLGPDGSFYIADLGNDRVRRVDAGGMITTLAGDGSGGFATLKGYAAHSPLSNPRGLAVAADGALYIADTAFHRIRRVEPSLPRFTNEETVIASEDGNLVHVFDPEGRHLRTVDAFTNAVLYRFSYEEHGYLKSIEDADGNITTIERANDGRPQAIVGPYGQRTALELDPNGYLSAIVNPAGDRHDFVYTPEGLLKSVIDPRKHASRITYDPLGRLKRDENAKGGAFDLTRNEGEQNYEATLTSSLGRATNYRVEFHDNEEHRINTEPDGTQQRRVIAEDREQVFEADGTYRDSQSSADPRFGILAPVFERGSLYTPDRLSLSTSMQREVELADETDPFSLTLWRETLAINARPYTRQFEVAERRWTHTSPEGRKRIETVDAVGRVLHREQAGLAPLNFGYDTRGRLQSVTEGSGSEARTTTLTYDAQGYLESVTDALNREVRFEYDPAGRVTAQHLPGNRAIGYRYDASGNLIGLTPPGRPEHGFEYDPIDAREGYTPPDLGAGPVATGYTHNLDKQLTEVKRPDGKTIVLGYDHAGRPSTLDIPRGQYLSAYEPATGKLSSITTPDGVLGFSYDGPLLTASRWSGGINGEVTQGYDDSLRVDERKVNGAFPIKFGYDDDDLLTQAGALSLERDADTGFLLGTQLGGITTSRAYNTFGELSELRAKGEALLGATLEGNNITAATLRIEGRVSEASSVRVNGTAMQLAADGTVTGEVALAFGSNLVEVEVYDGANALAASLQRNVYRNAAGANISVGDVVAVGANGDIYLTEYGTGTVWLLAGGSGTPEQPAWLRNATDASLDGAGRVYTLQNSELWVHEAGTDTRVSTLTGIGTPGDLEVTAAGAVYIAAANIVYRVDTTTGVATAFVTLGGTVRALDSSAFGLVAVVGEAFYRLNADATADLIHTGYYFSGDFGLGPDGTLCYADEGPVCVDPDGTEHWLDFFSESFEFDAAGTLYSTDTDNVYRVESGLRTPLISGGATVQGRLILNGTAGGVAYQADFVRDKLGRITQKTEIVEGESTLWGYSYDPAGRLETVTQNGVAYAAYSYDDNGNRLSKTQGAVTLSGRHDDQDRLLAYGNNQYSYTANGELLSKTGPEGVTGYTYDVLGNLMKVTLPDGTVIDYLIDGQNRRIGKKVNGVLVQGLLYKDQLNPVAELDGQGRVVARFVYGETAHVPAYMVKVDPTSGAEKTYRIVADHLGSPRLVIDVETREIAQRMDYDEFGVVTKDTNPGFQPFGFAGGLYDPQTGLVRFGARDYDAETGRWTAKDPIGFRGGTNLYAYVVNAPLDLIDVTGLDVTITINRNGYTENSVSGTIDVTSTVTSETFSGNTLENASPPNSNLPVPPGTYSASMRTDHTPNRVELIDVPSASNVQIHNANYPSQLEGCFAVGTTADTDFVGNSVNAMDSINNIISLDGSGNITVIVNGSATGP